MGMKESPSVIAMSGAKYWEHEFKNFKAGVYVPDCDKIYDVINFGYKAPYLIVFEEKEQTAEERASLAEKTGLSKIASAKGGSVVFVRVSTRISLSEGQSSEPAYMQAARAPIMRPAIFLRRLKVSTFGEPAILRLRAWYLRISVWCRRLRETIFPCFLWVIPPR